MENIVCKVCLIVYIRYFLSKFIVKIICIMYKYCVIFVFCDSCYVCVVLIIRMEFFEIYYYFKLFLM